MPTPTSGTSSTRRYRTSRASRTPARSLRSRRSDAEASLQPVGNLLDAGDSAGLVVGTTRRAADADAADRFLADLDRYTAERGERAGRVLQALRARIVD